MKALLGHNIERVKPPEWSLEYHSSVCGLGSMELTSNLCSHIAGLFAYYDILGDIRVRIKKEKRQRQLLSNEPVVAFIGATQALHPRVGEGANPAVVLLSTTTCEKSAFSESNLGTIHRAFPVFSLFKPQSQLTNDGYEHVKIIFS